MNTQAREGTLVSALPAQNVRSRPLRGDTGVRSTEAAGARNCYSLVYSPSAPPLLIASPNGIGVGESMATPRPVGIGVCWGGPVSRIDPTADPR